MMSTLHARRRPRSPSSDASASRATSTEYGDNRLGVENMLAETLPGHDFALRWVDIDEDDESDVEPAFGVAGADLGADDVAVQVIPKQADEFTCASCFLIHHMSRLASSKEGQLICTDCA